MASTTFGPLVTVSASYGSGGSIIAPRLAAALGVPFIDRLISADMSQNAARRERPRQGQACPASSEPADLAKPGRPPPERSTESLSDNEQTATGLSRFLSYFARASIVGAVVPDIAVDDVESLRQRTVDGLQSLAAGAPGVLLGRAGAVVLASRPRAFHVRLDGPAERRVVWAADLERLDLESARRRQVDTDRARTQFVTRLFCADPADARFYHLVVDSTVLGIDATTQLLASAARVFFDASQPAQPTR
jgi:cytidylate kinase